MAARWSDPGAGAPRGYQSEGRLKAKRTYYDGRWYDSKLEASVAKALDAAGMPYEVKPTTFMGSGYSGGQYTPDFFLKACGGIFLEVCGVFDERHQRNAAQVLRDLPSMNSRDGTSNRYAYVMGDGLMMERPGVWYYEHECPACGCRGLDTDEESECPDCGAYCDGRMANVFEL